MPIGGGQKPPFPGRERGLWTGRWGGAPGRCGHGETSLARWLPSSAAGGNLGGARATSEEGPGGGEEAAATATRPVRARCGIFAEGVVELVNGLAFEIELVIDH